MAVNTSNIPAPPARPDPDALVAQLHAEQQQAARGKLRIYFGSNAGVGKTYTMLAAAQRERTRVAIRRAGAGHIALRTDRDWVYDIARFVLAYRRTAAMLHTPPQGVSK